MRGRRASHQENVDPEAHQLGGEGGEPVRDSISIPVLDEEVTTLQVPQLTQTVDDGLAAGAPRTEVRLGERQAAEARHLPRLLRLDDRRGEEAESTRDERPPLHY
jgi:hypothetical protein